MANAKAWLYVVMQIDPSVTPLSLAFIYAFSPLPHAIYLPFLQVHSRRLPIFSMVVHYRGMSKEPVRWGRKKDDATNAPLPALDEKAKQRYKESKQRYKETISQLKEEIKAQHTRFKDKKATWKAEKKSLQAVAEESLLEGKASASAIIIKDYKKTISTLTEQLEATEGELAAREASVEKLDKKCTKLTQAAAASKGKIDQLTLLTSGFAKVAAEKKALAQQLEPLRRLNENLVFKQKEVMDQAAAAAQAAKEGTAKARSDAEKDKAKALEDLKTQYEEQLNLKETEIKTLRICKIPSHFTEFLKSSGCAAALTTERLDLMRRRKSACEWRSNGSTSFWNKQVLICMARQMPR